MLREDRLCSSANITETQTSSGFKSLGWNFLNEPSTETQPLRQMIHEILKKLLKKMPFINKIKLDFIKESAGNANYVYHLLQIKQVELDAMAEEASNQAFKNAKVNKDQV